MKIAIHNSNNKEYFNNEWVSYCEKNNISYKLVNAYDNNIIDQLQDCSAFMWHHNHTNYRDLLFAKQLLYSLQKKGIKVFPNFDTTWHFDDKVGQKYLLEAIDAPLVPSFVFYDKEIALQWIEQTNFPKVFKLRGGSGSKNVRLIKNKNEAVKLINKAFNRGFSQFDRIGHLKERYRLFKEGRDTIFGILAGVARVFMGSNFSKMVSKEKGYVYFQDFIPNNKFDTRVVVVAGRAAAERRIVRKGDFRASGSGKFDYDNINLKIVQIALETSKKLNLQSCAYDFVIDENGHPLIVEISYGFGVGGISQAPGYWDANLQWHNKNFTPQNWMIEELIKELITKKIS